MNLIWNQQIAIQFPLNKTRWRVQRFIDLSKFDLNAAIEIEACAISKQQIRFDSIEWRSFTQTCKNFSSNKNSPTQEINAIQLNLSKCVQVILIEC